MYLWHMFSENPSSLDKIREYKSKVAPEGVEDAFIATFGKISSVFNDETELDREIQSFITTRKEKLDEKEQKLGQIDDLKTKIGRSDVDKAVEYSNLLDTSETALKEVTNKINRTTYDIEQIQSSLDDLNENIDLEKRNQSTLRVAEARIDLAIRTASALEELYESLSHQTREQLSTLVNTTIQKIMIKPYQAEIDGNFKLKVFKKLSNDGDMHHVRDLSTGEGQVASLSFIASIVSLAKSKFENRRNNFFNGGIFPIVMDSPFGALDPSIEH